MALAVQRRDGAHSAALLRASLDDMLALLRQRQEWRKKVATAEPCYQGVCACGCGTALYGSPYGRRKRWVDDKHRDRARYLRKKAAAQASTGTDEALPARWTDRAQFDAWWASQRDE